MKFYSTNNKGVNVGLREAVIQGLAPDNGLYMPEYLPAFDNDFLSRLSTLTLKEIALEVAKVFVTPDDVPEKDLASIIDRVITFDAPLVKVDDRVFALELFHGPTLAFKDFGARFMSQLLGYFAKAEKKEIVILAATSGDTGSAVANGFLQVPGTRVVVLYPSGKVSEVQEKQFTTLGNNIVALEVDGTFDDCQRLVKQAFQDNSLREKYLLTSANSINIARLIPQSFYYFYAASRVVDNNSPVVFSVPSGNFGNLTAGLFAKRMGLNVSKFVVATNRNDVVPEYLHTGIFSPRNSVTTISNAMDVGNPSNFARILDLYDGNLAAITNDILGYAFSDDETRTAMQEVYDRSAYVLDPHGAVAYLGLKRYQQEVAGRSGIFLETAHPGKFIDTVRSTLKSDIDLPETLKKFLNGKKQTIRIGADFSGLKSALSNVL